MIARRRITSDVAIQIFGKAALVVISVAVTAILVRSLGEGRYGQWATLLALMQIIGNFGQLGLQETSVRRIVRRPADGPAVLGTVLVIECLVSLPLAGICAGISWLIASTPAMRIAGVLISATVIGLAPSIVSLIFQVRIRNDLTVLASFVNTCLWSILVLLIASEGGSLIAYGFAYLAAYTVPSLLQVGFARRLSSFSFTRVRELSAPMLRAGLPLGLSVLLTFAYARVDQVLVFTIAGDRAASLYGAVYRIFDQAQFIPLSVMTTLLPLFVAHRGDHRRLPRLVQRASDYLLIVAAPALMFAIVAGGPVAGWLFGPAFAPAGTALALLMATYALLCYGYLYAQLLVAFGLQRGFLQFTLIGLGINVAMNFALLPEFGYTAAAAAAMITQGVVTVLCFLHAPRHGRAFPRRRVVVGVTIASCLLAGVLLALRQVGAPTLGLLITAPVVYFSVIAVCRVVTLRELVSLGSGHLASSAGPD